MTHGHARLRSRVAGLLIFVFGAHFASEAHAERTAYITGAPVARACGGTSGDGQILSAAPKVEQAVCGKYGNCKTITAFNVSFRCVDRIGSRQRTDFSIVELFAFYHDDSTHYIFHNGLIGVRLTSSDPWHWLPRGYAPLPRGARFDMRHAAPDQDLRITEVRPMSREIEDTLNRAHAEAAAQSSANTGAGLKLLTPGADRLVAPANTPQRAPAQAPKPAPSEPDSWQVTLYALSPYLQITAVLGLAFLGILAHAGERAVDGTAGVETGGLAGRTFSMVVVAAFAAAVSHSHLHSIAVEKVVYSSTFSLMIYTLFLGVLVYFLIVATVPIIAGWHYLFVKHPAAPLVTSALATRSSIDMPGLATSVMPSQTDLQGIPTRSAIATKTDAVKARELADKLDADAKLVDTAIARERLRARALDRQGS